MFLRRRSKGTEDTAALSGLVQSIMTKRAIVTGITGQDGSYLAELLLDEGYEVWGMIRRLSAPNVWRIEHLFPRLKLLQADLLDQLSTAQNRG